MFGVLKLEGKRGVAFTFSVALWERGPSTQDNMFDFQGAPTLAAGDVTISKDNGAFVNLTNLPAVTPPASKLVQVTLTAAEMNADRVDILFSDVSGAEWCDLLITIRNTARAIDDLMYPQYQPADLPATAGVIPTLEQAIYMITQYLVDRGVTGSTVTIRKPDGSTLFTCTINNPTTPTDISLN